MIFGFMVCSFVYFVYVIFSVSALEVFLNSEQHPCIWRPALRRRARVVLVPGALAVETVGRAAHKKEYTLDPWKVQCNT